MITRKCPRCNRELREVNMLLYVCDYCGEAYDLEDLNWKDYEKQE